MEFRKSKATEWLGYLTNGYRKFVKETKYYRCKIVGIETNQKTKEIILLIMISSIKNQIVKYSPKEIVTNDALLNEFSPLDARAITFYALQHANSSSVKFFITGQEFFNGKTIFVLKKLKEEGEFRKSAGELYLDRELLNQFSQSDLIKIANAFGFELILQKGDDKFALHEETKGSKKHLSVTAA